MDIDESQLVIAAEQMILIYLYIVARAKIINMFAHLKYIQEFITPEIRKSPLGFLLATYETSLYTLLENGKEEIIRKSNPIMMPTERTSGLSTIVEPIILPYFDHSQDTPNLRASILPDELYQYNKEAFVEIEGLNDSTNANK